MSEFTEMMAQKDAKDHYIELGDGSFWYPGRDDNADLDPWVIARALSKLARFTGHTSEFYSVAEHSVKVSHLAPREHRFEALLHDAAEVLINDLSKPVKMFIGGSYGELEEKADAEVRKSFSLPPVITPEVKKADVMMTVIEGFHLMPSKGLHWEYYDSVRPQAMHEAQLNRYLEPHNWDPDRAADEFMTRFIQLSRERR